MSQIGDLEKSMRELEIAIQDKDAPLMVAESRMGIRQQIPRIELCRDPALHRLNQEVNDIENNIERYYFRSTSGTHAHISDFVHYTTSLRDS